jgi:hypothetical protein
MVHGARMGRGQASSERAGITMSLRFINGTGAYWCSHVHTEPERLYTRDDKNTL